MSEIAGIRGEGFDNADCEGEEPREEADEESCKT